MTPAALRATRALQKENGRRLLAGEEFLSQEEIAELIDAEAGIPDALDACRAILECSKLWANAFATERKALDAARKFIAKAEAR